MTTQGALVGFEEMIDDVVVGGTGQGEVEAWLRALAPAGSMGEPKENRFFLESYLGLRAHGWEWREALCIGWMSLGRDDRGELRTVADLCDFLGVSRMWFYEHKARYDNEPAQGLNAWDWWAERLQLLRLRGSRLAEVDEAVYRRAVSGEGKAADRELYYKRAGVLVTRTEVSATVGQAVDVSALSDDELDAMLASQNVKALELDEDEGDCFADARNDRDEDDGDGDGDGG